MLGASLAATVASSISNSEAASADSSAKSRAFQQASNERRQFDAESKTVTDRERDRYQQAPGQMETRAKTVSDLYKGNSEATPAAGVTTGAIPTSASNLTVQEGKKQGDKVSAFNTQQGAAAANLRSFGDVFSDVGRGVTQDRGELGTIGSFRQGSASVSPLFFDAASHAGDGSRQMGDLFGGLGRVGMSAALSGGGKNIANMFKPAPAGVGTGTGWTY